MVLEVDAGPTGVASSLGDTWNYATTRASSRFRVSVAQGGAASWNHCYGFGKTGTSSARGPQEYDTATWDENDNVEVSWSCWGADVDTTVAVFLADGSAVSTFTTYPKRFDLKAQIVPAGGSAFLQLVIPADTRVYVEINGNRKDTLCLFADPLGENTIPAGAEVHTVSGANIGSLVTKMTTGHPNVGGGQVLVVSFPPGIWTLPTLANTDATANGSVAIKRENNSMLMPVKPFTKIHLQRGAWVIGNWDMRNCNDMYVSGPGVISGEWASWSDMLNKLQGNGSVYQAPGQYLSFAGQLCWDAFIGTTYEDGDFSFPNMTARGVTIVGTPFQTSAGPFSSFTRLKVISHWLYNCDGLNGLMLDPANSTRSVSKCFCLSGDDGLFLGDFNYGKTYISDTHCIGWGGAPVHVGYWSKAPDAYANERVLTNCTVQSNANPSNVYGYDLYTGADVNNAWGSASSEEGWTVYSPYSAPASLTESIIKTWIDGNDEQPADWGMFNVTINGLHVEGAVPRALFSIENCYYPFGIVSSQNSTPFQRDKTGNISNLNFRNITVEQLPQYRSRIIGRDRNNTPHDISFENVTLAGELLTTWNWNDYVVQDSSPYNIFVEGRLVTTAVDVCNTALAHLGETANVSSVFPSDGSAQATLCNRFYNVAVEELLTLHPWSFATKRQSLTEDATNDLDQSWGFSYQVPGDVGRVLQVIPPDTQDNVVDATTRKQPSHTLEQDAGGDLRLYSNIEDAVLRYTTYVYDANKFPSLFVSALSWLLASKLAGPLIKGDVGAAEAKRCLQMVQWYIGKAVGVDGLQRNQKPTHSVPWISQR